MANIFTFFILIWLWLFCFSFSCAILDGLKAARSNESRVTTASPRWFFHAVFWRRALPYMTAFFVCLFFYMMSSYAIFLAAGYRQTICILQTSLIGSAFIGMSISFASVCAIVAPRCRRPLMLLLVSLVGTFFIFLNKAMVVPQLANEGAALWNQKVPDNFLVRDPLHINFENEGEFDPAPVDVSRLPGMIECGSLQAYDFEEWRGGYGGYSGYPSSQPTASAPASSAPAAKVTPSSQSLAYGYGYGGYAGSQPAAIRPPYHRIYYPLKAPMSGGKPFVWSFYLHTAFFWFLLADVIIGAFTWFWIRTDGIHWFRIE